MPSLMMMSAIISEESLARDTGADRQTGRQVGRQADKQTDRQTDRQTDFGLVYLKLFQSLKQL